MEEIKALEFYSGIGGMHYAIKQTASNVKVLKAFDINPLANKVYKNNFPDVEIVQRNIEALPIAYYERIGAELWTLSPPCQPYTRQGHQKGSLDNRSKSFLYIIEILGKMQNKPKFILIENVVGFEKSDTREKLVIQLENNGYEINEYILNPLQFGYPNSRSRYYMTAKRVDTTKTTATTTVTQTVQENQTDRENVNFRGSETGETSTYVINSIVQYKIKNEKDVHFKLPTKDEAGKLVYEPRTASEGGRKVEEYLEQCDVAQEYLIQMGDLDELAKFGEGQKNDAGENEDNEGCGNLNGSSNSNSNSNGNGNGNGNENKDGENTTSSVTGCGTIESEQQKLTDTRETLKRKRRNYVFDMATPEDFRTCCFTKSYGRYNEGTGSILKIENDNVENNENKGGSKVTTRYFTEREIANLMGFPKDTFKFENLNLSKKQMYKLLGNSLNVAVVTRLLESLLPN